MPLGPTCGPVLLLGSTWFTVGSTTPVERWVTVERGQPLFLVLVSMIGCLADACMDGEGKCQAGYGVGDEALADYLRDGIRTCNDVSTAELYATVDSHPLGNLFQYRAWSPQPFAWWYPAGSIVAGGDEAGGELPLAVTDGWYLLLAPLSPGEHVVRYGAKCVNPDDPSIWCTAILLYHITVK